MNSGKAVFLDRDGVLNRAIVREFKPYPPANLSEFEIVPDAIEACALLREQNFLLFCVTNQPDIARGTANAEMVAAMNQVLQTELQLEQVQVCSHDDKDNCNCRKPKPGMIMDAASKYGLDLTQCFMVGDRWRDIEAGLNAGCRTIFLNHGYKEKQPDRQNFETHSVLDAARWIVSQTNPLTKEL